MYMGIYPTRSFYVTNYVVCMLYGRDGMVFGVDGSLTSCRFFFQNPALGPFITKATVHLDRPRKQSGFWDEAVSRVAREATKTSLWNNVSIQRNDHRNQAHLSSSLTCLPPRR